MINILLYSLGFIYAQIISKEPIIGLNSSETITVKPTEKEKKKYISAVNFKEPIDDNGLLDAIFLNPNSKFGTEEDHDLDKMSEFEIGNVSSKAAATQTGGSGKKSGNKKKGAGKAEGAGGKGSSAATAGAAAGDTDKSGEGAKSDSGTEGTGNQLEGGVQVMGRASSDDSGGVPEDKEVKIEIVEEKGTEEDQKEGEGEGEGDKEPGAEGEAGDDKDTETDAEGDKEPDTEAEAGEEKEADAEGDKGAETEAEEDKGGEKEDEGGEEEKEEGDKEEGGEEGNEDEKGEGEEEDGAEEDEGEEGEDDEGEGEEGDGDEGARRNLSWFSKPEPHEEKIRRGHPPDKIPESQEVTETEKIVYDPETKDMMETLSTVQYATLEPPKQIEEKDADKVEEAYTSAPAKEGEEARLIPPVDDDIFDESSSHRRDQMDKDGFRTEEFEVPPGFFSDIYVKRKVCRKYPAFKLCKPPGAYEQLLDYIKAFGSSLMLILYVVVFAVLCFLFFFRMDVYYSELSNAISNGYMEFYEKQNPIMVITKLERQKLERISFQSLNAKRAQKKKGFFASLFKKKPKSDKDLEKAEPKPLGKPKTIIEELNTFDGRQYEINNKNLTPVIVTFDVMNKGFTELSNYIEETIEQDIIYFELEIEMLLGATEIILGGWLGCG